MTRRGYHALMRLRAAALIRWLALHPLLLDGAIGLLMTAGSWFWAVYEPGRAHRPVDGVLPLALTAAANLPMALRRRAPFTVLVGTCAAAVVYHALGYNYGLNSMAPLLALYTVAARRSAALCAAGTALTVAEWTHAGALHPGVAVWSALGQSLMVSACVVFMGLSMRLLAERTRELADVAAQLRREQGAAARRAVTQERVRIARELHDVVAHHMSVISVQAGLGRYVVFSDPATAHETLGVVADTSREALAEMRRLLSILRAETAEADEDGGGHDEDEELYTTTPGLGRLRPLADRMRAAGMPVEVRIEGEARPLPPGVDLCAYRVVQECFTNVLKHAGAARTEVVLTYGRAELTIRVTDDGGPAGEPPDSGGQGLMGMTERVRLYQGMIIAGPRPSGGFEVVVTFPLPSSPEEGGLAAEGDRLPGADR